MDTKIVRIERQPSTTSSMTISSRFLLVLAYLVIVLVELPLMSTIESDNLNSFIVYSSWLIVANLIIQTFFIYKSKGLVNFLFAFVALYYVFHFGQVVMLGLFPWYEYDYVDYISTYMLRNPSLTKETILLCIKCINFFVLGALLCPPQRRIRNQYKVVDYDYRDVCRKFFLVLFPFRVILDVIDLTVSFYLGYSGTFESFLPGVFSALGIMGYSIIPLYYFSIANPRKKKRFLIFILAYLLITMLSGNRGHQLVCIVGLFIVYLCQNKLSLSKFVILSILSIVCLSFIDLVYELRHEGLNAFLQSSSFDSNKGGGNIVLETLGTFGETIFTPYLVLENYNSIKPFWGECFVKSIASIIPDFFGTFKDINNEAVFAKMVSSGHTIGGSFSGEMYYNFGNTYLIPTMIIGFIFSRLSSKVAYYIRTNDLGKICIALPVCVLFIWWIRDSIGNMTREIVWLYFVFVIIKMFSKRINYAEGSANS